MGVELNSCVELYSCVGCPHFLLAPHMFIYLFISCVFLLRPLLCLLPAAPGEGDELRLGQRESEGQDLRSCRGMFRN